MNRREVFTAFAGFLGAVAAGAGAGLIASSCIDYGKVMFPRDVRYIGGPLDGTIHTLGPEVKLGSKMRVKGSWYSLHTLLTTPEREIIEWVWIYNA